MCRHEISQDTNCADQVVESRKVYVRVERRSPDINSSTQYEKPCAEHRPMHYTHVTSTSTMHTLSRFVVLSRQSWSVRDADSVPWNKHMQTLGLALTTKDRDIVFRTPLEHQIPSHTRASRVITITVDTNRLQPCLVLVPVGLRSGMLPMEMVYWA